LPEAKPLERTLEPLERGSSVHAPGLVGLHRLGYRCEMVPVFGADHGLPTLARRQVPAHPRSRPLCGPP
jgi:hypothetical protein